MEACLRLGIEPSTLRYRPLDTFQLSREGGDLAELAFNFNEAVRQARPASPVGQARAAISLNRSMESSENVCKASLCSSHSRVWKQSRSSSKLRAVPALQLCI